MTERRAPLQENASRCVRSALSTLELHEQDPQNGLLELAERLLVEASRVVDVMVLLQKVAVRRAEQKRVRNRGDGLVEHRLGALPAELGLELGEGDPDVGAEIAAGQPAEVGHVHEVVEPLRREMHGVRRLESTRVNGQSAGPTRCSDSSNPPA